MTFQEHQTVALIEEVSTVLLRKLPLSLKILGVILVLTRLVIILLSVHYWI